MRKTPQHLPLLGPATESDAVIAWRKGRPIARARFLEDVLAVAQALPEHAHVINVCDDRYLFMVGFAAAVVRGQVSLLPPSRVPGVVIALAAEYADCYLLSDGHAGDGALPQFRISVAAQESIAASTSHSRSHIPTIDSEQLAAILFTSGSTGQPAPNPKTWGALVRGARASADALLQDHGNANAVATVHSQHMYGFETTILWPLQGYCAVQCDHPLYPEDVRRTLAATPAPRLLITTPVHLRTLVAFTGELPAVSQVLSATAPLSRKLALASEARLGAPLNEVFGSTETGITATRRTISEEYWRLLDLFEMESGLTDTLVRSRHLGGTILLQDVIEQLDDRHFRLIGRSSDLISIAGKRASLGDLNVKLQSIDGVLDGVIFMPNAAGDADAGGAVPRTAAFVVAPGLTREQVVAALRQVIDPAFLPRPLFMVDALPRGAASKLPRAGVLKLFAETLGDQGA
jgi:acyl-coenzyme A synthetase/AMP-(fatty) acid ligase